MQNSPAPIPNFPTPAATALRALPLFPLSLSLSALARRIAVSSPGLFRRLGQYDQMSYILDPTDLPLVLRLDLKGPAPRISAHRTNPGGDARIAGPLAALLGLVHGAYDGDALFFSRDLIVEGDTAAALALRNAIDDAELDLSAEITAFTGPFAKPVHRLIALVEKVTGVALSRPLEPVAW